MKYLLPVFLLYFYVNVQSQTNPTRNWIDSEIKYTDSKGNLVNFTHGLPRGGGMVQKNGEKYSHVVFWTRIQNQSDKPIHLKIKFPEVTYIKSPESYIEIVLPKATMSIEKLQLYDYGLTNMQSLLNNPSNQLSALQKIINPKEEYFFYTTVFLHTEWKGPARAKFELNKQDLFYKFSLGSDTTLIPCGILEFKN